MHDRNLEPVRDHKCGAESDENQKPQTDLRCRDRPERDGATERERAERNEYARRDLCTERSALKFVERMRGDAHRQKERKESAGHHARIGHRSQSGPEQHVREVPQRVRRVQQRPVIADPTGTQGVERGTARNRRHRGPLSGWRHRNPLFGGAILHTGHYYACAEAHSREVDVDETRLTPVPLERVLRVRRVEALDASAEKCADARPLLRNRSTDERQPDSCVSAPHRSKERIPRHTEVERDDSAARPDDTGKLAHDGGGIVDVAQEVREGHMVERFVRKGQRLGASTDQRNVAIARRRGTEHVRAAIEPDHIAAVADTERTCNETGAGRHIEHDIVRRGLH